MAEGTFIVLALVICLALIAGLYFVIERLSDRVFTLATQARAREQNDIINHERIARTFNELVDETTALADALKNERILRSHTDAVRRVAMKQAARADGAGAPTLDRRAEEAPSRAAVATNQAIHPSDDEATCVLTRADLPSAARHTQLTPTRGPILDQPRRTVEQGEPCHLVVGEHGRQLGKVVVEVAIERRNR